MSETGYLGENNHPTITIPRQRLQDRVPIDAITTDARQAKPGRAALGLVGAVLFAGGWISRKIFGVLFLSGAWCFSAVKLGWRQAGGEALTRPDPQEVLAENSRLRMELERLQLGGMG